MHNVWLIWTRGNIPTEMWSGEWRNSLWACCIQCSNSGLCSWNYLIPIVHFWLHHTAEKIVSAGVQVLHQQKWWDGEVGGVTHMVLYTCWLLGLAVKRPWLAPGEPVLTLAAWLGLETLLSPYRGPNSGRDGCLGAAWVASCQPAMLAFAYSLMSGCG